MNLWMLLFWPFQLIIKNIYNDYIFFVYLKTCKSAQFFWQGGKCKLGEQNQIGFHNPPLILLKQKMYLFDKIQIHIKNLALRWRVTVHQILHSSRIQKHFYNTLGTPPKHMQIHCVCGNVHKCIFRILTVSKSYQVASGMYALTDSAP